MPEGSTVKLPVVKGKRDVAIDIDVRTTNMGIKASKGSPTVPTIPELKNGFLETLRADATLKEFLACKLEKFIHDKNSAIAPGVMLKVEGGRGWDSWMLWTPPYKPALQPIEEFWGAGKNYSASLYKTDRTMKEVIAQLQAGWYGDDGSGFMNARKNVSKEAVDCGKLVKRSIAEANRMAKEIGGLSGKVEDDGGLVHDGESDLHEGDGDTDMYIRHIEEVDLTKCKNPHIYGGGDRWGKDAPDANGVLKLVNSVRSPKTVYVHTVWSTRRRGGWAVGAADAGGHATGTPRPSGRLPAAAPSA